MTYQAEQPPLLKAAALDPTTELDWGTLTPEELRATVIEWHNSDEAISNDELDHLILGNEVEYFDELLRLAEGEWFSFDRYKGENLWVGGNGSSYSTPYNAIRSIVKALNLSADDVLYDLGAGYGRMAIYSGITTPASCKGVEILTERVKLANENIDRLGLDNVELIAGHVLDVDFSDGDTFYLFLPFRKDTFQGVIARLKRVATAHKIRVVMRGGSSILEPHGDWLSKSVCVNTSNISRTGFSPQIDIFESL